MLLICRFQGADRFFARVVQVFPFDGPPAFGVYVGGEPDAQAHLVMDFTGYFIPVAG